MACNLTVEYCFCFLVIHACRYPEDVYDRFWEGAFHTRSYPWIDLSTTQEVKRLPGDEKFMVPTTILQKASTIDSKYSWLNITVRGADNLLGSGDLELLPIFHFAEIASTTRLFDIYSDGEELFTSFSPSPFQVDSMYQNGRFLRRVNSTFTLRKQPTSQLPPPLINAFEVYSLVRIATASDDGMISNILQEHITHSSCMQQVHRILIPSPTPCVVVPAAVKQLPRRPLLRFSVVSTASRGRFLRPRPGIPTSGLGL